MRILRSALIVLALAVTATSQTGCQSWFGGSSDTKEQIEYNAIDKAEALRKTWNLTFKSAKAAGEAGLIPADEYGRIAKLIRGGQAVFKKLDAAIGDGSTPLAESVYRELALELLPYLTGVQNAQSVQAVEKPIDTSDPLNKE